MTRPDPDTAWLLRPDGSVTVPAAVAGEVLRALVRDLTARVRLDGGEVSPQVRQLLYALHAATEQAPRVELTCDTASVITPPVTVEVTVDQAAAALECTPQWVRHLIGDGRLRARRAGARLWLIDRADLDAYRTGAA